MNNPPRILLVDDDPLNRQLMSRRLSGNGFDLVEASDGRKCLELLTAHPCDLVLLDINMPGMSGLDVVKQIRRKWTHDMLPVILVTALGEPADVVAGLEAGANDYISKPFELPVLLARVQVGLKIKHNVELLMEAERQRVLVETLGNACNQLSQPLTAITMMLEGLIAGSGKSPDQVRDLTRILNWMQEAGALIHKLRQVAREQGSASYTQRMEQLDRDVVPLGAPKR
ncbi:MAG TPA: response regulator [Tepidisphaeraceae bacterium]|nr:response regulator [Tepidisphaeraceae bacterium]